MSKNTRHAGSRKFKRPSFKARRSRNENNPHNTTNAPPPPPALEYDPLATSAEEAAFRARQARHQRHVRNHRHERRHRKKHQNRYSEEDDFSLEEGAGHEELKIIEDDSMALVGSLQNQSVFPSTTTTATDFTSYTTPSGLVADENKKNEGFKEWVPHFGIHYRYSCLFRFASCLDYMLMAVGTIAALLAGCCIPAIIYLFGNLIRVKVLVDKMGCTIGTSGCDAFLETCEENAKDHSKYNDRNFLERPVDNKKITTEHLQKFLDHHLMITCAYCVSSSIYFFCWNYASQNQGGKLRRAYFQSLLRKDLTWFETQEDPENVNRLLENTRFVQEVIGEAIPIAIHLIVMCILCTLLSLYHGRELTLMCLSTLPIIWFSSWVVNELRARRVLKERRAYRIPHEIAKEVFSNIRTVIGYGTQMTEKAFYKRELGRGNHYVICAIFVKSLAVGIMYLLTFGLWAFVFWYGMGLLTIDLTNTCSDRSTIGVYDAGDVFTVTLSVIFGVINFYIVINIMRAASVAKQCARDVLKVVDSHHGIDNMGEGGYFPEVLEGKVEFIDVRFTYPGKRRGLALNNLNFVAEPNTTVAIVGLTDSGKSTTLKLICKEYLADSGFVEIDGYNVRDLDTNMLRTHIGYITQELGLFDMTIEDNVRMGKLDANFFEVQEACMMAGAHDFIISYKEGYQTRIGHKGNRLTPGQKQLLAIARALIRDPKILLLDEPTYALDSQSVIDFMRSLQSVSRNRTVILVAHRLATVVHANMIYVLKNGRVVEQGDHHKLLKSKGAYHQLCMLNRPSNSYHPGGTKIEGFDTSEITRLFGLKTFNQKPIFPNLYNDMSTVDPVISSITHAILTSDKDTERGFHAKLEWTLKDGEETLPQATASPDEDALSKQIREGPALATESLEEIPEASGEKLKPVTANENETVGVEEEYHAISILNPGKETWVRVLIMGSTNYWLILIGSLSTILLALGMPAFGFLFALIIDMYSDMGGYPRKWKWAEYFDGALSFPDMIAISIAALGCYSGLFSFLQDFCLNLAAFSSVHKVRRILYACILNQDMSFFDDPKNTPSHLASVLFQDTNAIRHVSWGVYATLLQCIVLFFASFTLCVFHAPRLTGYTLLFMSLIVGANFVDGWLSKRQIGKTILTLQHMSKLILQVFQNKHIITVCQMEPYYLKEFTSLQIKNLKSNKGMSCWRVFTYGIAQSAVFWGFGFLLYLGEESIVNGSQNFLDVMITGFVLISGLITLGTNLSSITGFKHINKGGKRMLEIINRQTQVKQEDSLVITEDDCTKDIEFVNTQFWKPLTPDTPLLKGINLKIPPNQVTAIVGYPESGKSSFFALLGRYYDPTGGLVTIAGKDIRYYSSDSLRQHLSVITKEPELFSRTVAQNIALGAVFRKPSMEDVIQAAKAAKCHNLIVSLPEGYETRIGGENDYLSNAQKQKISIARALLKNPKILVCDEITHALDKEGEKAVLESLEAVKHDRTLILISHRIQPVQYADWIIVMEGGYLEEQGTHEELLQRRSTGIYAQMWRSQNPLQDENFLRGKISFAPLVYDERKEKPGSAPKKKVDWEDAEKAAGLSKPPPPPATEAAKPATPPPAKRELKVPPSEDDDIEATPLCGGFFSFLGLGIVEPKHEDEEDQSVGDKYRKQQNQ